MPALFPLASAFKQGDLAVGGTADDRIRAEARAALSATTLAAIRCATFVADGITDALARDRDTQYDRHLDSLTVAQLRAILLAPNAAAWVHQYGAALSSESIAAVVKVMTDDELSSVACRLFNPIEGPGVAIGSARHFGSRIQPNSPGDDPLEILFSILEGLSYGCGDVILGLNPASDDLDTIVQLEELLRTVVARLELPTRYCVLSDLVKQHQARQHARVDVAFQSLAGTSSAIAGMIGMDVDGLLALVRDFDGLYFETGQGSEVTNGAAEGLDMVTLEARTYGLARFLRRAGGAGRPPWLIVNDVAGFIGPEVFSDAVQLERACLEDCVMAKLHGLTMGLDVCATFHMGITPAALRQTTERIVARAAPAYLMSVAGNADPMLGYLTTSFREHPRLRRSTGRHMASPMADRLIALGAMSRDGTPRPGRDTVARLYAVYVKAAGDRRTATAIEDEGRRHLEELQARGFDLGIADAAGADTRLDAIYAHARRALYAAMDPGVLNDACPRHVRVRTRAASRDDYLAHPASGEQLHGDGARAVAAGLAHEPPLVQLVVSDGLNADAVNEQLRAVLPPLRRMLQDHGCPAGDVVVVIQNGRVRAGYEVGALTGTAVVVHLIGERPGTGLNTLSAYLTFGRDDTGRPRWSRSLDHAATTAVCGIHPRGKAPLTAAAEIASLVERMLEERRSGVALGGASR